MTRVNRLMLLSLLLAIAFLGSLGAVIWFVGSGDRREMVERSEAEWAGRKELARRYLRVDDEPGREALTPPLDRAHAAMRRRLTPPDTLTFPPPDGTYLQMLFWLMMAELEPGQYDRLLPWVQGALRDAELKHPPNLLDRNLQVLERELEENGVFERLPDPASRPSTTQAATAPVKWTETAKSGNRDKETTSSEAGTHAHKRKDNAHKDRYRVANQALEPMIAPKYYLIIYNNK